MAYKVVDLRGKIPGNPAANQGAKAKKKGVVIHYNGDDGGYTGVVSGQRAPFDVYVGDANWHMKKDWAPPDGVYANGIQYHYGVWEDTVYILRNPDACLWHCNDWKNPDYAWDHSYNYNATAINVPISANERASARTLQTLRELCDYELRRQGRADRAVKGHKEISSTACPGSLMRDFVEPYRENGAPGPFASWVNLAVDNDPDARVGELAKAALSAVGFAKAGVTRNVAKAARDARDGALGEFPCVLIGAPALAAVPADVPLYSDPAQKVWFDKAVSDLWDAVGASYNDTEAKVEACLRELCRRMGLDGQRCLTVYHAGLGKRPVPNFDQHEQPNGTSGVNKRGPDDIVGAPIYSREQVLALAKKHGAGKPALEMIPPIYEYARERNLGADFLSVQMLHETGFGRYGGDSRPYNPAGIKTSRATGDTPSDFEVPLTAPEGARMLVNHWCAVLDLAPIGTPHGRYAVARDVYRKKPKIAKISQLGSGNWATDPAYAQKLYRYLRELGSPKPPWVDPQKDALARDVEEAIALGMRLKGTPYGNGWIEGTWPDGPSLYARCNPAVHTVEYVRNHEVICSAFINILRAHVAGLPAIGRNQGDAWPGGTAAISRTFARMRGCRPYPPVENTPRGWLVFSPYLGPALALQGHVGVALGNGRVLEARLPAVSDNRTEDEGHRHLISNGGQGYVTIIPPEVWLRA